jgi:hypothetical protein
MGIMTEGIQPAVADSFAVKLEVNLTARNVVTFHLRKFLKAAVHIFHEKSELRNG